MKAYKKAAISAAKGFHIGSLLNPKWLAYKQRVLTDLGLIRDESLTQKYFELLRKNNIPEPVVCLIAEAGVKPRVASAIQQFATKVYSLFGTNDATQTTAASQPYLKVPAAPNERASFQNPNGDSRFMTHPTVSFGAGDAWTVQTVANWEGHSGDFFKDLWGNVSGVGRFEINRGLNNILTQFKFTSSSSESSFIENSNAKIIGKNTLISVIASGTGNLSIYVDNLFFGSVSVNTNIIISSLLKGFFSNNTRIFNGKILHHSITPAALNHTQIALTSNFWSTYYPEIPTVAIGSQQWATSNFEAIATPMGNLIANVTENVNVEKITNGGFDTDTVWVKSANVSISSGVLKFNNADIGNSASSGSITKANTWYKLTYTVLNYASGISRLDVGGSIGIPRNANGTYIEYVLTLNANAAIITSRTNGSYFDIDNVSVQEIGWSGSTELYDGIYAKTSGTVEQKTYAAVKAAAMWCYYNNDSAIGAWAGKLYNWYAVKLLQMDIDYYNAANPTTPWGYRVPTDTDFNTLATTLGGASVAGGKMKKEGLNYWNSPNTGADNSSGFSAVGGGKRDIDGLFSAIKLNNAISILSLDSNAYRLYNSYDNASVNIISVSKTLGQSLRLIKS